MKRRISAAVLLLLSVGVSSGYYHFLHFTRLSPFRGIPEKFDLNALPGKTLSYFVSDQGGIRLAANDTYLGLISQIRSAAKVWNDVETSELRLAFGGFIAPGTQQNAPTLEILFDEMEPGVVAIGGVRVPAASNGSFVPIQKSVVIVKQDLSALPSYSESLFGTLVHEMGHAIGLQHTFTSSVMSTNTRATTKANPIAADDIASVSLLYPSRNFLASTGSISGRVTMAGSNVSLASVVAISPNGSAVSALTNPDGTYRIDGLPPRTYFVYVHPLPPPIRGQSTNGGIVYPRDAEGRFMAPGAPFETVFYPNVKTPQTAIPMAVSAGSSVDNINFAVRARSGYGIHTVETYSFPANTPVKPAYIASSSARKFMVMAGTGLVQSLPGLTVSTLGGTALAVKPYEVAPAAYLQVDLDASALTFSSDGPRHLVFTANNDIYVLPSAYFPVDRVAPVVSSVAAGSEGALRTAVLAGTNLTETTRVLFDGIQASGRTYDAATGRLTVTVPPAPNGHRASIVALNDDGQSSLFHQSEAPAFSYGLTEAGFAASAATALAATPASVAAGSETAIQIDGLNTSFAHELTAVGLGTSDISIRRVWVVSPTRMIVNIAVSPNAQVGGTHLTVVSGLQVYSQPFALTVTGPPARPFSLAPGVVNAATGQGSVSAGGLAIVTVAASPSALNAPAMSAYLGETRVAVAGINGNQVLFSIPAGASPGPVLLRLELNGEKSAPIAFQIDPPAPRILGALSSGDQPVTTARPIRAGDMLSLNVANLDPSGMAVHPSRVAIHIGTLELNASQVIDSNGNHKVILLVPANVPSGPSVPVRIVIDERVSDTIQIAITT